MEPTTQEEALIIDEEAGDRRPTRRDGRCIAAREPALDWIRQGHRRYWGGSLAVGHRRTQKKSDKRNGGFAGRLRVSQQLAGRLEEPVQDLANLGEQYASELTVVNPGVLTLIRMAKDPELSAEDRAAVQELFRSILGAVAASRENVPVLAGFASSAEEIAKFSKKRSAL